MADMRRVGTLALRRIQDIAGGAERRVSAWQAGAKFDPTRKFGKPALWRIGTAIGYQFDPQALANSSIPFHRLKAIFISLKPIDRINLVKFSSLK